ncbi:MAG: RnfABCDGE type electron transport complex subunit D [Candidatus Levybacteria bacterium]|nr:RnfABCDGE type electron transport complex subunit D [Candidatus Levybacteria bacterium]
MLKPIDDFLNKYTMYKVVLYGLLVLVAISFLLSFAGILFYNPVQLSTSLLIIFLSCFLSNFVFSKLLHAPTNVESYLITALILFFIFLPVGNMLDVTTLIAAGVIAMGTKYIFAIKNKHIFNPAAASALILGLLGSGNALWWVGSDILLPFVVIIGLLIVRKIRRFRLFFAFLIAALATTTLFGLINENPIQQIITEAFTSGPLIFFATVMLTEPLTTPPTKKLQMLYGGLVGILFGSQFAFGPVYSTPELALIIGNIYSYIVSPKTKMFLSFKEHNKIAENTYEYVFRSNQTLHYKPGQYLEWTLPHKRADMRGNRRYFTIASSPTEKHLRLGVKIGENGSSFKKKLTNYQSGDVIVGSQLTGDFTMPDDASEKLVFIAGGIGVTPFRSMIKYLLDKGEKRSIILFYANKTADEIAYKDIFDRAQQELGLKSIYVLSDKEHIPSGWLGKVGRIDETMITQEVPDFKERTYYLSGPNAMVDSYKHLLLKMGVSKTNIVTDYFPGF